MTSSARLVTAISLRAALPGYVDMLETCVADGASIGFLHPMPAGEAEAFWRGVADGVAAGDILMWSVEDDGVPVGTIQLHPVGKPNGAHRAEIAKLMVHPRARGRGLARVLMATAEQAARDLGRRLLVLDTVEDSVADGLYRRLGWTEAGRIPDFALKSGGGSEATVVFWKRIEPSDRRD
jgi:acetyltransferase